MALTRQIAPWLVLTLGLVLATAPAWRFLVLGWNPSLDELLQIVCLGGR